MMENGDRIYQVREDKNIWETVRSDYESLSLVKMPWIHAQKKASYHNVSPPFNKTFGSSEKSELDKLSSRLSNLDKPCPGKMCQLGRCVLVNINLFTDCFW